MKQYKFKCPICGKWHGIRYVKGQYHCLDKYRAECNNISCKADDYTSLSLESYVLPKLLKLLHKLNIEVCEVFDKLRWSKWHSDYAGWLTQYVIRDNILGRYIVSIESDKFDSATPTPIITSWAMGFEPKDYNSNTLKLFVFDDEKGITAKMKRLCQADFNKRRAK